MRYCSSRAFGLMAVEDLVQEAVLVTLGAFDGVRNKDKLLSYMIGIVNNIIKRKRIRSHKFGLSQNGLTSN